MRKWHRWFSVTFGVVLLWIAVTGVLSQVVPLVQGEGERPRLAVPGAAAIEAASGGRMEMVTSTGRPEFRDFSVVMVISPPRVCCRPSRTTSDLRTPL